MVRLDPLHDIILDNQALAARWSIHPGRVNARADQLGVPKLKFNKHAFGWRLSDVLEAEARITVAKPKEATAMS
jgi:hypothetical protein